MPPTTARPLTLASLALAVTVPLAAPAQAAPDALASKNSSTVILRVEPTWSAIGEQIELSGELYDSKTYRALGNRPVTIQTKPVGGSTWTNLRSIETNASGGFSFTRVADATRTYRALYRGNAWYYLDGSNWVTQQAKSGARTRISLYLRAEAGETRVKGRLTKMWSSTIRPLTGAHVYIERAKPYSESFVQVKALKTDKNGWYSYRSDASPKVCNRYRAVYRGNSTFAPKSTVAHWSTCT